MWHGNAVQRCRLRSRRGPISRAQHHVSASRGWHVDLANHSRHSRGTTGTLPPVAEGSFSPARILFACLERVRYACREEPATPIMRSLQGIVRVLHAGYCHASGQPLRRALSFHQRFHSDRAHKRSGHQCGACTILLEIRADERYAGLIGTPWAHVQLQSERRHPLDWRTQPTTSCTPRGQRLSRAVLRLTLFEQRADEKSYRCSAVAGGWDAVGLRHPRPILPSRVSGEKITVHALRRKLRGSR